MGRSSAAARGLSRAHSGHVREATRTTTIKRLKAGLSSTTATKMETMVPISIAATLSTLDLLSGVTLRPYSQECADFPRLNSTD